MAVPKHSILQLIESEAEGQKILEHLLSKLMPIPFSGCQIWLGANDGGEDPYGKFIYKRQTLYVHRSVWELKNGPVPPRLVLDHNKFLCGIRSCCNDYHLEPVSYRENTWRGKGRLQQFAGPNKRRTHQVENEHEATRIYTPCAADPVFGDNEL